jgi:hypothetical protein
MAEVRYTTAPLPEGCRWCGEVFREHGQRYVKSKGFHIWESPTQAQIQARMRVRFNQIMKEHGNG